MSSARLPAGSAARFPLSSDPSWQAFKDAAYRVLAEPRDPATGGRWPRASSDLGARLATLHAPPGTEDALSAAVYDRAHDLGRLMGSKRVVGDDLAAALEGFSGFLEATTVAQVSLTSTFHRDATLRVHAGDRGAACAPFLRDAFIAGALQGFLEETFNCRAHLLHESPDLVRVRLAEGRDINLEAHTQ